MMSKHTFTDMWEFYEIAAIEDVIYIENDLPDEYTGAKYTRSLKGAAAKAKQTQVFRN